jgi:epoxyqueuosine reductase
MGLAGDLRECARVLEIDCIRFCSADSLDGAPKDRGPRVYLEDATSIVSIGYTLNYAPIQNLPVSRSAYMLEHDYANRHLDQNSHKIARFLEKRGFKAIGFDAGAGFYAKIGKSPETIAGDFSHKHAAIACGLGKFGLNNLVLNSNWGPRIRLTTIVTNAPIEYRGVPEENPCLAEECLKCIDICPVHALDGWKENYDPERGWVMDKRKCYDYAFTTLKGQRCGLCIKVCPVGVNSNT